MKILFSFTILVFIFLTSCVHDPCDYNSYEGSITGLNVNELDFDVHVDTTHSFTIFGPSLHQNSRYVANRLYEEVASLPPYEDTTFYLMVDGTPVLIIIPSDENDCFQTDFREFRYPGLDDHSIYLEK